MANEEQLNILRQGVNAWNKWRTENPSAVPDLRGADLSGTNLRQVNFRRADLSGANLGHADLQEAILDGADLGEADLDLANLAKAHLQRAYLGYAYLTKTKFNSADLSEAFLREANLQEADLSRANLGSAILANVNLARADLSDANLTGADLSSAFLSNTDVNGVDVSHARLAYTTFARVDLNSIKGIETVTHQGPSTIGIETIYRSKGKIPVEFLRGAGVPDNFIEYMSSLTGTAFEFYSCFISHSNKDEEFARRLFADLQTEGVRCWFAPHHVQAGKKLHEQIDVAIRLHERLLLILSPDSINSEWVKTEIAKARKRENQEKKRVLFPVRLNISYEQLQEWECFDADRGKDSAREIREYYIPDFTKWKDHDQYQKEFKKLVRDLKKRDASAPTHA